MLLVSTVVITYLSLNPSTLLYKMYDDTPKPAKTIRVQMILVDLCHG